MYVFLSKYRHICAKNESKQNVKKVIFTLYLTFCFHKSQSEKYVPFNPHSVDHHQRCVLKLGHKHRFLERYARWTSNEGPLKKMIIMY